MTELEELHAWFDRLNIPRATREGAVLSALVRMGLMLNRLRVRAEKVEAVVRFYAHPGNADGGAMARSVLGDG